MQIRLRKWFRASLRLPSFPTSPELAVVASEVIGGHVQSLVIIHNNMIKQPFLFAFSFGQCEVPIILIHTIYHEMETKAAPDVFDIILKIAHREKQ